ncbi:hypothetical protein GCM10007877_25360 [Marinibactrum halimedae]|uniref:Uncharacterized protein n=1 Tax=Marinibactrum halimedae TaxID=1444977 RepID=A0AA37TCL1_9GAMM|nr:hypothetical protein GCM10007877_25360 [Marinibactrum halimedae]
MGLLVIELAGAVDMRGVSLLHMIIYTIFCGKCNAAVNNETTQISISSNAGTSANL